MTDLVPVEILSPVVQLETTDRALGGTGNPMNRQAQALLNRDAFRAAEISANAAAAAAAAADVVVLRQDLANTIDPAKGSSLVYGAASKIQDVAELRTFEGRYDGDQIVLQGHTQPLIGGGLFVWDSTSTATDDNGLVIAVTGVVTGRWLRQNVDLIMAEYFGAVSGVANDSSAAFQAASDAAGSGGAWGWSGRHRVTTTINIPRRQAFGSFGANFSWNPGGLANWQGVNTINAQALESAVFFDPPTQVGDACFFCEEGAIPHDFTLYSLGFNTIGVDVQKSQPEASHYNVVGIAYNKYIKPKNVAVALCKTAYESKLINAESGNYYTSFNQCEFSRCFQAMSFASTDPFNTKLYDCKVSECSRLLDCSGGIRNFVMYGGSVEGYRQPSAIRGGGAATFLGTYFETTHSEAAVTAVFYLAGSDFTFTVRDCLIYINNCLRFFLAESGYSKVTVHSSGNSWTVGTTIAASHTLFSISTTINPDGYLFGDKWTEDAPVTATYVNTTALGLLKFPEGFTYAVNNVHLRKMEGIAFPPLAAAPASPQSGVIYMANGGTWDPLVRAGGFAYPVIWRGAWEAL